MWTPHIALQVNESFHKILSMRKAEHVQRNPGSQSKMQESQQYRSQASQYLTVLTSELCLWQNSKEHRIFYFGTLQYLLFIECILLPTELESHVTAEDKNFFSVQIVLGLFSIPNLLQLFFFFLPQPIYTKNNLLFPVYPLPLSNKYIVPSNLDYRLLFVSSPPLLNEIY